MERSYTMGSKMKSLSRMSQASDLARVFHQFFARQRKLLRNKVSEALDRKCVFDTLGIAGRNITQSTDQIAST